jgi:hypothetical protein
VEGPYHEGNTEEENNKGYVVFYMKSKDLLGKSGVVREGGIGNFDRRLLDKYLKTT